MRKKLQTCCVCSKLFHNKTLLAVHELIHEEKKGNLEKMERIFPCPHCSYIAASKKALRKHTKHQIITINVSILDTKGCYDYKEQYEQFKLIINNIGIALALTNSYFEH